MRLRACSFFLFCPVIVGAWVATVLAQNSLPDFGLKENELKQRIVNSLVNGTIPVYPGSREGWIGKVLRRLRPTQGGAKLGWRQSTRCDSADWPVRGRGQRLFTFGACP